jgi:hypothetical protein
LARTFWILLFVAASAATTGAAPIYGDVTLGDGVHLWSLETFEAHGYWTPEVGVTSTIDNHFQLGPPVFDGLYYRVDAVFPSFGCGSFQVDAWYHGGWWGEVRDTRNECVRSFGGTPPGINLTSLTPTLETPDDPTIDPRVIVPVPEPGTVSLFGLGLSALLFRRRRKGRPVRVSD